MSIIILQKNLINSWQLQFFFNIFVSTNLNIKTMLRMQLHINLPRFSRFNGYTVCRACYADE